MHKTANVLAKLPKSQQPKAKRALQEIRNHGRRRAGVRRLHRELHAQTAPVMVFKLLEAAQKSWRRLDGHNQLPKLVPQCDIQRGIEVIAKSTDRQPITAAA
ncbi:hypothetical protein ACVIIV_003212 [Bradyrhizobium sp. USDA 4354]